MGCDYSPMSNFKDGLTVVEVRHGWVITPHCFTYIVCGDDLNKLRPRESGHNFADGIFKYIFLNENVWIPMKIPLTFVPKGPIENTLALVQIMAWRSTGDTPWSEPMMASSSTHMYVTQPQWVKGLVNRNTVLMACHTNWWRTRTIRLPFKIYKPKCYFSGTFPFIFMSEGGVYLIAHILSYLLL